MLRRAGAAGSATGVVDGRHERTRIVRELFRGHPWQAVAIYACAALSTVSTLLMPVVVGRLIAAVQAGDASTGWIVAIAGAGFAAAVASATASFLLSRTSLRLLQRLRSRTMAHALQLPLEQVRAEGAGGLLTRVTMDAARIKAFVDIGPVQLPVAAATVLGTLVVMAVIDWLLLLVTAVSFSVAAAVVLLVVRGLRRRYVAVQERLSTLSQRFAGAVDSLVVVKAAGAEERTAAELADHAEALRAQELGAARLESLMVPVVTLGQQIALVAVISGGGARLVSGAVTLGELVAFLLYLFQLAAPLLLTASGIGGMQAGAAARRRFDEFHGRATEEAAGGGAGCPAPASVPGPAIAFRDVTFGYDGNPVLTDANFEVPATGLTAVVGPSGAGKSTVLALVERFVHAGAGRVEVAGQDVRDWSVRELRARTAYVDQGATLLHDTVRANLVVGLEGREVPDADLEDALARVGLLTDVRQLPAGLDTALAGSVQLSGGQRQRLALARALLSDAELVLLDEPSSQLDHRNEGLLREAIAELGRTRAVVVVAHRSSTVRAARHVVVVRDGSARDGDLLDLDGAFLDARPAPTAPDTPDEPRTVPQHSTVEEFA